MLAADDRESQQHVKTAGGLLRCRREGRKRISVFAIPALGVIHRAVNLQATNILVAIGLRQGNPETGGTRGIGVGGNMHLIREFERARWCRSSRLRKSLAARMGGEHGNLFENVIRRAPASPLFPYKPIRSGFGRRGGRTSR